MIIRTIELIPSDEELSIDSLQTLINNGDFDDILAQYNFLIMTTAGICLVKKDKSITLNACVDLSNYVIKEDGKSLMSDEEIERLALVDNYDDTEIKESLSSIPSFKFTENGNLEVTIDDETKIFAPQV